MNFEQAMTQLKNGQSMKRQYCIWYIKQIEDTTLCGNSRFSFIRVFHGKESVYISSLSDIFTTDWEVYNLQ